MKTFFMTLVLFISFAALAQPQKHFKSDHEDSTPQTNVIPPVAPGASGPALKEIRPEPKAPVAQKQETSPGIENTYPIGDYNKNGEYNFFDRLEKEKRSAQEEAAEQQ